jgi:hypothetical protein
MDLGTNADLAMCEMQCWPEGHILNCTIQEGLMGLDLLHTISVMWQSWQKAYNAIWARPVCSLVPLFKSMSSGWAGQTLMVQGVQKGKARTITQAGQELGSPGSRSRKAA